MVHGEMEFAGVSGGGSAASRGRSISGVSRPPLPRSRSARNGTGPAMGVPRFPFNQLWVNGGNAQMGVVQTSLLSTHDAGNGGTPATFRA